VGLANLSSRFRVGNLLTQPLTLPRITTLDISDANVAIVHANSFDGMPALRWLSMAGNTLTFVSDATFSAVKQPVLAAID